MVEKHRHVPERQLHVMLLDPHAPLKRGAEELRLICELAPLEGRHRLGSRVAILFLEPVMKVEVTTPEEFMGDVVGDINSKRGRIEQMSDRAGAKIIDAMVPLSEMFGYATTLRSMTQGRAAYSMEFDHYADVPRNVAEELIGKKAAATAEGR